MSDLVGNPEDRFSHNEAQIQPDWKPIIRLILPIHILFPGKISCNGEGGTNRAGGASGGSVKLATGTLNGKGTIEVNGGKGNLNVANSCTLALSLGCPFLMQTKWRSTLRLVHCFMEKNSPPSLIQEKQNLVIG